jgi:hypothetical protein
VLRRKRGGGPTIATFACGCEGKGGCAIKVTDTTLVCISKGCANCLLETTIPARSPRATA